MSEWETDKRWADRFMPEVKSILGRHLICEAPPSEDRERNTDLIVLKLDSVRIACRIRRFQYELNYWRQFTIRTSRPSGQTTELYKMVSGFGDYLFYGFSNQAETGLSRWFIGDLFVFRGWFNAHLVNHNGDIPGISKPNPDGSSEFRAFELSYIPDAFVIARSDGAWK